MTKAVLFLALLSFTACTGETDDTNDTDDTDTESEEEPNDAMEEAYALTLPATIDAAIDPSTDEDWYSFDASTDVTVAITEVFESLELYIDVKDSDGLAVLSWDTGARGATFSDTLPVAETGTFYLRIHSAYGNDTGTYTLSVQ